jgi:drug/metabolite transporter (DMT)-like permease
MRSPVTDMVPRPPGADAQRSGLALAAGTALVSGTSVFVNSYGVHAIASPVLYTTAKNLVAFVVLGVLALAARAPTKPAAVLGRFNQRPSGTGDGPWAWVGLVYVGVVGGGLAFALFFTGLAHTTATPAAFWHDSLVVWVAVLAVPFLAERVRWWNALAVVLLVAGQVVLVGGVGALRVDRGQAFVLAATVLWSVEVVVAKRLLSSRSPATLSLVRMGVGGATLLGYLTATGQVRLLGSFGVSQVSWALFTGLLLAAYVATWVSALARARAVDVSSVLVGSVFVTALLQEAAGTIRLGSHAMGLVLVAVGTGLVVVMGVRRRPTATIEAGPP